jgi:hypothetical protein
MIETDLALNSRSLHNETLAQNSSRRSRLLKLKIVFEIVPTCLVDVLVCSRPRISEGC